MIDRVRPFNGFDYVQYGLPTLTTNPGQDGATWVNLTSGELFICTDATTDANVWHGQAGTKVPVTGYKLSFNGTNSYVDTQYIPVDNTQYMVMFKQEITNVNTGGVYKGHGISSVPYHIVQWHSTITYLAFGNNGANTSRTTSNGDNQWWTVNFQDSNNYIKLDNTTTLTNSTSWGSGQSIPWTIGKCNGNENTYCAVDMFNFYLFETELSLLQIQDIIDNGGPIPSTPARLIEYDFEDNSSSAIVYDKSGNGNHGLLYNVPWVAL